MSGRYGSFLFYEVKSIPFLEVVEREIEGGRGREGERKREREGGGEEVKALNTHVFVQGLIAYVE